MLNRTLTANDYPEILKPEEAAKLLGMSTRTLERWRRDGEGPPFKRITRRTVRYMRDAVVAWAEAKR